MIHYRIPLHFRIPLRFRKATAQTEKKPKDNSTIPLIMIRTLLIPQDL